MIDDRSRVGGTLRRTASLLGLSNLATQLIELGSPLQLILLAIP
jgi:hypothetical protein